jgi:cell division septation protein DedD
MSNQDQDPYTPDPYGQGPYRPGPAGERMVPPPTESGGGGLRIGRLVVIGLAGGAVLYLLLSLIAGGDERSQVADATSVPLIRANPEPSKVPPDAPGGLEVPDQDKLIFDRIGGGNADSSLPEQLLPPPDEPMARPTPPPPPPPMTEVPPPSPPTAEEGAPTPLTPPAIATPAPAAPVPAKPPATAAVPVAPAPAPAPATPPKPPATAAVPVPAAPATPAPSASGAAVIQLAALKDEATAKQAWARIAKANSDLLAGLKPIIVPVQVNGSTLYRLRAGPFATKDAAAQVCAKLKQRNQDCNVVR